MLDQALERMALDGPDLRNGMTSHAPMVVEALCALGRPDAVMPWLDRYRAGALPRPPERERIDAAHWRRALSREDRFSDWSAFFANQLASAPWRDVLDRWVARLAPGICAAATHGVIRVGHAARALGASESSLRLAELADALASWASTYQELPAARRGEELPTVRCGDELPTPRVRAMGSLAARDAIARVARVPLEERRFTGTIVSSLEALAGFPAFADVIGLLDTRGEPVDRVADLAEVFARVLLGSAHDPLTAIVFTHGVTSVAAFGNLLPHIEDATARAALPFVWQSACGLYAAFGSAPAVDGPVEPAAEDAETLVERAIAHGDEHAIKLAEACLARSACRPSPVFGAAVQRVLALLPPA